MRILLIDDDPSFLSVREAVLRANGVEVLCATSAGAGIELAQRNKVDAVVLDYSMPDMDGEEVARVLKQEHPETPIILSSGWVDIPERVFKLVDAFVAKGDGSEFLIDVVRAVVPRKKLPQQERRLRETGS